MAVEGVGQGAGPKKKTLKRLGGRAPRAHPPPTSPSPQFVTLAGFHSLNHSMFELAAGYAKRGMSAYSELQTAEFASEGAGYTATKHQREVRGRRGEEGQFFVFFFSLSDPIPLFPPSPPLPSPGRHRLL